MGNSNIVVFALSPFLSEISGECRLPVTNILGCVVKGIAQISRASLFHVWVAIFELPGLVS